jgi:hypothetical protein
MDHHLGCLVPSLAKSDQATVVHLFVHTCFKPCLVGDEYDRRALLQWTTQFATEYTNDDTGLLSIVLSARAQIPSLTSMLPFSPKRTPCCVLSDHFIRALSKTRDVLQELVLVILCFNFVTRSTSTYLVACRQLAAHPMPSAMKQGFKEKSCMDILLVGPLATDCCRDDDPLAVRPCCANTFQVQLQSSCECASKMFGCRCLRQILQIPFCRQTPYNQQAPQRANVCSSQYGLDYLVIAIPFERSEPTKTPAC